MNHLKALSGTTVRGSHYFALEEPLMVRLTSSLYRVQDPTKAHLRGVNLQRGMFGRTTSPVVFALSVEAWPFS